MKKTVLLYILLVIFILGIMSFICCKSFEPVIVKGLPNECNLALSAMSVAFDQKDKSIIISPLNQCFKVLHRERCKNEVFGLNDPVKYEDALRYRNYNECLKELD